MTAHIDHDQTVASLLFGSNRQKLQVLVDFAQSDIVVLDEGCGQRPADCQRYCQDGMWLWRFLAVVHLLMLGLTC